MDNIQSFQEQLDRIEKAQKSIELKQLRMVVHQIYLMIFSVAVIATSLTILVLTR